MTADINWILSKNDWISFMARRELIGEPIEETKAEAMREDILSGEIFQGLINDLMAWPGGVLKRHNDSSLLLHKLAFLADAGIKHTDGALPEIIKKVQSVTQDGVYPVLCNFPTMFGGSGEDELLWMLCDAPTVLYALAKMGMNNDPEVISAARYLVSLQDDNGWRCKASSKLGGIGGPGRKDDPCPYANLLMLKLIAQFDIEDFRAAADKGLESILNLWRDQGTRKERMFGIGTDFRKPKAPLIWFDIVHVLDVFSNYSQIFTDKSFVQMLDEFENMLDEDGRLTAQSMYRPWKEWEFSNKKEPSRWLTFLAYRILKRTGRLKLT